MEKMNYEDCINRNGVVNEKKLLQKLEPETANRGVKSGVNLSAQSTKQCVAREQHIAEKEIVVDWLEKIPSWFMYLRAIVELMQNGAVRISEALEISPDHILSNGRILIKGKKGSEDRIVQVFVTKDYFSRCKKRNVYAFAGISRYHVYREFKKLGIGKHFKGKSRASVTHYFRQQNARLLESEGVSDNLRKRHLGHKGDRSIKFYSNGKK